LQPNKRRDRPSFQLLLDANPKVRVSKSGNEGQVHTRKSNWIILAISWVVLGFFAHGYYLHHSYDRHFALVLLSTMALSLPLFIFAPISENKSWPLIYRLPSILGAAVGAFTAAKGLNPCSNGCDDEPVVIAWFGWSIGLAFLNRKNLGWKYW